MPALDCALLYSLHIDVARFNTCTITVLPSNMYFRTVEIALQRSSELALHCRAFSTSLLWQIPLYRV